MTERLKRRFAALRAEGRAGLAAFVTAGDPDPDQSLELLKRLPAAGADLIELGLPSRNPNMDGPVIQAAHARSVASGVDARDVLDMVAAFRATDRDTPVIMMGYADTLHRHTLNRFFADSANAGADAALIVDATGDDWRAWRGQARENGIPLIPIAQATDDEIGWMRDTFEAEGFVYAVASAGPTGGEAPDVSTVAARMERLRRVTPLPVVCGFGIRAPETARALGPHADALAIGTAIGEKLEISVDVALKFVGEIAASLRT